MGLVATLRAMGDTPTSVRPPSGTRDLYPEAAARRRYLTQSWRDVSIRHGFEEIDGPTFEQIELYTIKSGEGIMSELFQAFSGKDPTQREALARGEPAPFALRPEFTPTLARMYAARAGSLPRPTRWFSVGPYFRAERPQRGRLREFLQWNADVLGLPGDAEPGSEHASELEAQMDAETIACCADLLNHLGVVGPTDPTGCTIRVSDRRAVTRFIEQSGGASSPDLVERVLALLDRRDKVSPEQFRSEAHELGFDADRFDALTSGFSDVRLGQVRAASPFGPEGHTDVGDLHAMGPLSGAMAPMRVPAVCSVDPSIVRGLAYYTGTVFEVIAQGERAIAGGGRYDGLIELMGGPPTPAVGFAMGDVVVSLLLEEQGLMPEGAELLEAISRPPACARPEVFVVSADEEHGDPHVVGLIAALRRGVASSAWVQRGTDAKPWHPDRYAGDADQAGRDGVRPLHARRSSRSTRNLKKLLSDAERQRSRFAAVVHGPDRVQLKDLDTRHDLTPADIPGLPGSEPEFAVDPQSDVYVGRAVVALTG